jgi:Ca2+-dependent lipid-binding protein
LKELKYNNERVKSFTEKNNELERFKNDVQTVNNTRVDESKNSANVIDCDSVYDVGATSLSRCLADLTNRVQFTSGFQVYTLSELK